MTAGRIFTLSLLGAMLCIALFYLLVPGLMVPEPPSFDARIGGYDHAAAHAYIAFLDSTDLEDAYLTTFRRIDSVFPIAVFGLLASAIWGLWARPSRMISVMGVGVTVVYLGVDYAENAAIASMIHSGAEAGRVAMASMLTQLKWGALLVATFLVAAGFVLTLIKGGKR